MNRFTKIITLILVVILSLCACTETNTKAPYNQGLELIKLITEMAESDAYAEMFSNDESIVQKIQSFALGNRSNPTAVYKVTLVEGAFREFISLSTEKNLYDDLSTALRDHVSSKDCSLISTLINHNSDFDTIAATNICTAKNNFICKELTDDVVYIYTYENALPVAVTFSVYNDNIVEASAMFIGDEDFRVDSAESIEAYFNSDIKLVKVEKLEH